MEQEQVSETVVLAQHDAASGREDFSVFIHRESFI
jgi:hypothetical protein